MNDAIFKVFSIGRRPEQCLDAPEVREVMDCLSS